MMAEVSCVDGWDPSLAETTGAALGHLRKVDFLPTKRSRESVERGKDTKVVVRTLHAHWFGELFEGLH